MNAWYFLIIFEKGSGVVVGPFQGRKQALDFRVALYESVSLPHLRWISDVWEGPPK